MKKITLSVKNIWNKPIDKVSTVAGLVAGLLLIIFKDKLDPNTVGGGVTIAILAVFARKEEVTK